LRRPNFFGRPQKKKNIIKFNGNYARLPSRLPFGLERFFHFFVKFEPSS
jgi:hypothetical protein